MVIYVMIIYIYTSNIHLILYTYTHNEWTGLLLFIYDLQFGC